MKHIKYILLYLISFIIGIIPINMGVKMYLRDVEYYNDTLHMFPNQSIPDYSNICIGFIFFILIQLIAVYIHIASKIK